MSLSDLHDLLPAIAAREAADPERYPAETIAALHRAGVLSAPFAREFGGEDASLLAGVDAIEALAANSGSAALLASMPLGLAGVFMSGLALVPAEHRVSCHVQVERAAAAYARGELYAACNSEKGAGGALTNITTRAELAADAFVLQGEKILASGGENASMLFSTAKVPDGALQGSGPVEFFLIDAHAPGVEILSDWDGFGMRATESQTVRYHGAPAGLLGFPNFVEVVQPVQYWFCLFAAIPLGCARAILSGIGTPTPSSPALRLRLSEATMRYEALRAYLRETAAEWHPAPDAALRMKILRMKTFVTQESTKLAAELFALGGGRHYRRNDPLARALADSFAGTALRPPLQLGLETLMDQFSLGEAELA
jgi:alkylation response protein AidB-like acyl-CoA dehydrogenase